MNLNNTFPDFYEKLPASESSKWLTCPKCKQKPRTWRFNNGCYALCLCFGSCEAPPARMESVNSYAKRHEGSVEGYDRNALRRRWNQFVITGNPQNHLPTEQW